MSPTPIVPRPSPTAARRMQAAPETPSAPVPAQLGYLSEPVRVLWIGLGGAIATVFTLGVYRFWLRTYLRRHHWSRVTLAGDPFEYRGRAIEILSGALIAIVIIAVYLAVVATILNFVSLAAFDGAFAGFGGVAVLLGLPLAPLWPYAAYRSRRYFLTRLSWRGVRFSLDLEAWRYALMSSLLGLLTIFTLGLAKPYADFQREKFVIDRTWFGDKRLALRGSSARLYRGYLPVILSILLAVIAFMSNTALSFIFYLSIAISYVWYLSFRLHFFVENIEVGSVRTTTRLTPRRILSIYIISSLLTALVVALIGMGLLISVFSNLSFWIATSELGALLAAALGVSPNEAAELVTQVIGALTLFGVYSACSEAFFFTLALNAIASTTQVSDLAALEQTAQRRLDRDQSAEGFADALGVDGF